MIINGISDEFKIEDLKIEDYYWNLIREGNKIFEFRKLEKYRKVENGDILRLINKETNESIFKVVQFSYLEETNTILLLYPHDDREREFLEKYYQNQKYGVVIKLLRI